MEKPKVLSGYAIVNHGVTRLDASLPELGLKDVIPNGSWLEQKQIQSTLESRKHMIAVERIEKFGTLSHAIWQDDLNLAEVTQKTGGHWQYLGHNVGKTLYLMPEETLLLMELNCLLLKHNGVTVSLQKAYSLLLRKITLTQYRVYASLSRLGYKILRHNGPTKNTEQSLLCPVKHSLNSNKKLDEQPIIDKTAAKDIINKKFNSSEVTLRSDQSDDNKENSTTDNITLSISNSDKSNISNQSNISDNSKSIDVDVEEIPDASIAQSTTTKHTKLGNIETNISVPANVENKNEIGNLMDVAELVIKTECEDVLNLTKNETESKSNTTIDITPTMNEAAVAVTESLIMEIDNTTAKEDSQECTTAHGHSDNSNSANIAEVQIPDNNTPTSPNFVVTREINNDIQTDKLSNNSTKRRENVLLNCVISLKKRLSQQTKQGCYKTIAKYFENIPEMFEKEVITINAPAPEYIPKNVFVNQTSYMLNIKQIKNRCARSLSADSPVFNNANEVNSNQIRRIQSNSNTEFNQNLQFVNNIRFPPRQTFYFRPFNFWRPQNHMKYVSFNMLLQRSNFPNMYYHSHFQYQPRPMLRPFFQPNNVNANESHSNENNNTRKRLRNFRTTHLHRIKNLAARLKQFMLAGNTHIQNIESLHRLLIAFNNRYKARLRLNKNFEVVDDENIVETIELDADEDSRAKRPKLSHDKADDKFGENLDKLRQLALKLKDLVAKSKSTSKHRRALSKAIKTFNKSYDADIYMNKEYEVIDKRFINLDSDSDSDCVVKEPEEVSKNKKLKNPFYILKQRSEKVTEAIPSTSKDNNIEGSDRSNTLGETNSKYFEHILKTFDENWLPKENDFGSAEVQKKSNRNLKFIDIIKDEYLYGFINTHYEDFNNWLEAKLAFLQHIEETNVAYQDQNNAKLTVKEIVKSGVQPLINVEDRLDTPEILEKLRIIKNNTVMDTEARLIIHFDVYNRDVQNFRKTNLPKPHFRIICMEKASDFPSASDVMTLYSKYDDSIPIVFAIAGVSSISYLQINPIDLPVYVADSNLV